MKTKIVILTVLPIEVIVRSSSVFLASKSQPVLHYGYFALFREEEGTLAV